MAIKRLRLTDDHLKLISSLKINEIDDDGISITQDNLFGGDILLEDIATILGLLGEAIPNTKDDANGRAFPDEVEALMLQLYSYISNNLYDIETLVHQFSCRGGLTAGIYKCKDNEYIWEKEV